MIVLIARRTLLLCAILLAEHAPAHAQTPVLAVDDVEVRTGQPATVAVRADAPIVVGATDLRLSFDAGALEVIAVESSLDGFTSSIDGDTGTIRTASATGGAGQAFGAGDPLLIVRFQPRPSATSCTAVTVADADDSGADDLAGPVPPIPPLPVVYRARAGSVCVNACGPCDDGDHCTTDTCDPAGPTCVHAEPSPNNVTSVTCSVANLRDITSAPPLPVCAQRCAAGLERRIASVERHVSDGVAAARPGRCRRELRAATRAARTLRSRILRLGRRGSIAPSTRTELLAAEAKQLVTRARSLAIFACPSNAR